MYNQMITCDDDMKKIRLVEKILRSMPKRFNYVVISTEESQDWENVTIKSTIGTLQAHEDRASENKKDTSAQTMFLKFSVKEKHDILGSNQRCRGCRQGRGRGG